MLAALVVILALAGLADPSAAQPVGFVPTAGLTDMARPDLAGFWKVDCGHNFGVKIEHAGGDLYSLSFCGPGGCFEPGTWAPNSPIFGDSRYRVLDRDRIQLPFGDGFNTYHRCPSQGAETTTQESSTNKEDALPRATEGIHFKKYYEGLPDLDRDLPFAKQTPEEATALRAFVLRQRNKSEPCPTDQVAVPGAQEICGAAADAARAALHAMSRGLDAQHFSHLWLVEFGNGTERDLLAEYDRMVSDGPLTDRYASFFFFRWNGDTYNVTAAAWFLEGSLHAVRPFGPTGSEKPFLRFLSCTECHPWVYLTILDPYVPPVGEAFVFSYKGGASDSWGPEIEFELPGMGHSIEAKVETRLPERPAVAGPHLLQHFAVEGGEDEWWVFTCKDHQCSPQVFKGKPPQAFLVTWKKAKRL
jgi:hypothetical protein